MKNIPRDIVSKKWDGLPEAIKEAIFSPDYGDTIVAAGEKQDLDDFQKRILLALTGDVLMGFEKPSDLPLNISNELKIDSARASAIYREIDAALFTPLAAELKKVYGSVTEEAGVGINTEATEAAPPTGEPLRPAFAPGSPFILHAEEEVKPAAESGVKPALKRPSFYKPAFSEYASPAGAKPEAARLELGVEATKTGEPKTVKVGEEEARVVHYSDMRTPLDPFSKIPANDKGAPKDHKLEKKDVHPDNVVNLKDLPL